MNEVFYIPEEGVDGPCGPMTSPPGKVCRATSGHGRKAVFGRGLMKSLGQEVGAAGARHKETSAGMIDNQAVKNDRKRRALRYRPERTIFWLIG